MPNDVVRRHRIVSDIHPTNISASFGLEEEINLREVVEATIAGTEKETNAGKTIEIGPQNLEDILSDITKGEVSREEELAAVLEREEDPVATLTSIGAMVGKSQKMLENLRPASHEDFYHKIISQIRTPMPGVNREISPELAKIKLAKNVEARVIEEEVVSFYKNTLPNKEIIKIDSLPVVAVSGKRKPLNFAGTSGKKRLSGRRVGLWMFVLLASGALAYGFVLKNELVRGGVIAFENLEEAGENLKQFNFGNAEENFGRSYQDFSRISQTMDFMGVGLIGFFSDLPGFDQLTAGGAGKLKSAKDMAEAGKLIAQSGQAMSQALVLFSHTGSILNPADKNTTKPLKIVNQLKDALALSNKNFQKAKALISDIDESMVPEDKRESFGDFKDKLPLLEEYLGNAIEYTEFLEGIVGIDEPKKYLLLFNNYSELRPTGGFPGTYGVVSFSSGGLSDFFVDDVYNLDGQLKRNIIPPKQLQHITPTWGMRDSPWFIDFPSSSKKTMSFFSQEAGYKVDGVLALNPDIVSEILAVIGPVQMPEYGLTLSSDNFLESIQEEVEYGPNRDQPKKVVVDFGSRFLEKLYSANSEQWTKIFNVLMAGLDERDIMFYFDDKELENFAVNEGFGGEIKKVEGDYLTVNFSNVKGSKTDVVTNSAIQIDNRFEDGRLIRKVTITRVHKGGDHKHGFYNRQNPAYVRVLMSQDAELLNISGNDLPNFRPLVNYSIQGGFEKDRDLSVFESNFYSDTFPGVDKFEESGKKGLGFWMITDPRTSKKIEFEYSVPISSGDYSFYFQKQPGLDWKNFVFKLNNSEIIDSIPPLNRIGDLYMFEEILKKDFEVKIKLK